MLSLYSPVREEAASPSYRSTMEMQSVEMLKIMLKSNCLQYLISGRFKMNSIISGMVKNSSISLKSALTGDETDGFVRFKFSGDVMSLVIPVFMGLILNRESNKELRTLLDLKLKLKI